MDWTIIMATKTKEKESAVTVRVVTPAHDAIRKDEVSITSDEPYVNRTVFAFPGVFTDGEFSADAVAKLEAKSTKALDDAHAETLAKEAKEREEAAAKARASKEA